MGFMRRLDEVAEAFGEYAEKVLDMCDELELLASNLPEEQAQKHLQHMVTVTTELRTAWFMLGKALDDLACAYLQICEDLRQAYPDRNPQDFGCFDTNET